MKEEYVEYQRLYREVSENHYEDNDKDIELLKKALEIAENCYEDLKQLGIRYAQHTSQSKKLKEALICFKRANILNPNSAEALHNLGIACVLNGDADNANQYFVDAMAGSVPNNKYDKDGINRRLIMIMQEYNINNKHKVELVNELIEQRDANNKGIQQFQDVKIIFENNIYWDIIEKLGRAYILKGNKSKGIEFFDIILNYGSNLPDIDFPDNYEQIKEYKERIEREEN